jgi:hypothetical protein
LVEERRLVILNLAEAIDADETAPIAHAVGSFASTIKTERIYALETSTRFLQLNVDGIFFNDLFRWLINGSAL